MSDEQGRAANSGGGTVFERRESAARGYCRSFDKLLKSGRGSKIEDVDGVKYLDFLAGCGSLNYGHNDPDMKAALIAHIQQDGLAHALDLHTDVKQRFLEAFERCVLTPRGLDYRVQFTGPTGANAVEAALKLARKTTGRRNVIAFTNGFHGVTMGALAATGNKYNRMGVENVLLDVHRAPFDGYFGRSADTAAMLEQMLDDPSSGVDAPAAILVECVQGEGGLNVASPRWLRRIADIARRVGALLIVDEVQTGCGRTGDFFAFEESGVRPDLVVMAKSVSGFGLPMALLLINPQQDLWKPAEHNGTFRGNTHAFVTATVALEKFWSDGAFRADIARRAELAATKLRTIAATTPNARLVGRGMMQGVDFGTGERAAAVAARCVEQRLLIETSGAHDQVVKMLAPLTTPDDELCEGLDILARAALPLQPRNGSPIDGVRLSGAA